MMVFIVFQNTTTGVWPHAEKRLAGVKPLRGAGGNASAPAFVVVYSASGLSVGLLVDLFNHDASLCGPALALMAWL